MKKPFFVLIVLLLFFCLNGFSYLVQSQNVIIETFNSDDSNRARTDLNISDDNLSIAQRDRWDISTYNVLGYDYNACGLPYACGFPIHYHVDYGKNDYAWTVTQGRGSNYWDDYNYVGTDVEYLASVPWGWTDFNFVGVSDTFQHLFVKFYWFWNGNVGYSRWGLFNFTENEWEWFFTKNSGPTEYADVELRQDINGNYIQDGNLWLRIDANRGDYGASNYSGIVDAYLTTNNIYDSRNVYFSKNIAKSMSFPEVIGGVKINSLGYFPSGTDINYYINTANSDCEIGGNGSLGDCIWHKIDADQTINFDKNQADFLKFKIELGTNNNSQTPKLQYIQLDYNTIIYNVSTDVNILGDFNSFGYIKGGTDHNVSFSLSDSDDNASEFLVDVNFSPSCQTNTGYSIFNDLNLSTGFWHDTNNLGAGFDVNFTKAFSVPSTYDFNACMIVQLWHKADNIFYTFLGDYNFLIDSTKPSVSWDGNLWWNQNRLATITLTGHDVNSGVKKIWFKQDLDWQGSAGSEVFASDVNFVEYTVPLVFGGDGNFALWFFASDFADWNGDVNKQFVLINSVFPSVSILSPDLNTSQSGTTWVFQFNFSDSNDSGWCDFNAMSNGVAIVGQQGKSVGVSGGVCVVSFDVLPGVGDLIDVNVSVRDLNGHSSGRIRSNWISYIQTRIPPGEEEPPGGGGGGPVTGGIGGFCITAEDCDSGLLCLSFSCVLPRGDFNGVVVYPTEITSPPFVNVLPGSVLELPQVIVSNLTDGEFSLEAFFDCAGEEFCAKDWCVFDSESEFVLPPRGSKILRMSCTIDTDAEIGGNYLTQLIIEDQVSGLKKGVNVTIVVRRSEFGFLVSDAVYFLNNYFFGVGVVCFVPLVSGCVFTVGNAPLNLGFVQLSFVSLPLFLFFVFFALSLVFLAARFPLGYRLCGLVAFVLFLLLLLGWFIG